METSLLTHSIHLLHLVVFIFIFSAQWMITDIYIYIGFIIPAELSSTCYTTTEAPVIAHHAKLGGLRLAPKGPAIKGGAPPIKGRKGRGVNWFTYRVAFVRAQTHLHYSQSRSLERGGGH